MIIPLKTWTKYKDKLAAIDRRAEVEMISFVQSIGGYGDHVNECLDYAFALATKYGEAAGAAACELYEAVAAASGLTLEAMPAATATYEEVAKSLNGIHKISNDPAKLSQGVSRLVKRTAADTTLQNAARDGAYFAWVPSGDTCAFCLMLASNGWRRAGKKTLKGNHAEHIHANCDCQYAVTFDPFSGVEGYDPAEYEAMFDGIDGDWDEKVKVVRHQQYAKNKDRINAQKRAAYAKLVERNLPIDEGQFTTLAHPRNDGKQQDVIKPHRIIKDLNKSDSGKRALQYIDDNSIPVGLFYDIDAPKGRMGIYDPINNVIEVYVDNTRSIEETAITVIHEATHARLGAWGTRKEEVRCFIEEMKHKKRTDSLTRQEIKDIIKNINRIDSYKDLPWR